MRIIFCFIRLVCNSSLFEHASYRANGTRGNRIARILKTMGTALVSDLFNENWHLNFLTFQEKQNIRILMVKGEIICTHCKTSQKSMKNVSEAVQIKFIFCDNIHVFHMNMKFYFSLN